MWIVGVGDKWYSGLLGGCSRDRWGRQIVRRRGRREVCIAGRVTQMIVTTTPRTKQLDLNDLRHGAWIRRGAVKLERRRCELQSFSISIGVAGWKAQAESIISIPVLTCIDRMAGLTSWHRGLEHRWEQMEEMCESVTDWLRSTRTWTVLVYRFANDECIKR
jgi:hypothetical protein